MRTLERVGEIPAAAITAYVSDRERRTAIEAGFQMHMEKPIGGTELIAMVINLTESLRDGTKG